MINRRLTLELLRLAVKEKVLGGYALPWLPANWEHLYRMIQDAYLNEKQIHGKDATNPPSERTFKDFLNQTSDEFLPLRSETNSKKGMPYSPCTDYLVHILGLGVEDLLRFELHIAQIGLHPDAVVKENSSILQALKIAIEAPQQRSDQANTSTEIELDVTMDHISALEGPTDSERSFGGVETPDNIVNNSEQSSTYAQQPKPISKRQAIWTSIAFLLAIGSFFSFHWYSRNMEAKSIPESQIQIHTSGDNSPIIHNLNGNVQFWGKIHNDDTIPDSSSQSKNH